MPKGSEELTAARKDEIITACAKLYDTMSFKDITIKEIGRVTSFTRTSIYNYFQTKEEIFLALMQKEYEIWNSRLRNIRKEHETMSREDFAHALACSVEERGMLLKLLSMNLYDLEENTRLERLVDFKRAYGESVACVKGCLEKFFPEMTDKDRQDFIFAFFPFLFGVYPYTTSTRRQCEAMKQADVYYVQLSIYEITVTEVKKLLGI